MEALAAVIERMFVKYWIYVCGTMFFLVSFEGKVVLYKVVYMLLLLCCVALYQVSCATASPLLLASKTCILTARLLPCGSSTTSAGVPGSGASG